MATVASTSRVWNKTTTINWWAAKAVFSVGVNVYVVTQDTGASPKIRVHKSNGRTMTFTEQDSANAVSVSSATSPFSAWSDGTHIHIAYYSATNTITHVRFVLASNTWTTGFGAVTTDGSPNHAHRLVARSDGDVLVFFSSNADDADIKYARYEGSTWTEVVIADITDGGHSQLVDAVMDSADIAHVFYHDAAADDFTWASVDGSNTLSSLIDVDSAAVGSAVSLTGGNFELYTESGTEKVIAAYSDSDLTIDERVASLEAAAASGSLDTQTTIEGTASNAGANLTVSTAVLAGTPYAVWWDDAANGTFFYSTKSGGTWAARTTWKTQTGGGITSTTNMSVQAITTYGGGLLVLYQDGTDVKVDWIVDGGPKTHQGAASLDGVGSLAGAGRTLLAARAAIDGVGSLSAAGVRSLAGASSLDGVGGLSALGGIFVLAASALSGVGTASPNGNVAFVAASALDATGTLTAAGARALMGAASLSGTSDATIDATVIRAHPYVGGMIRTAIPVPLSVVRSAVASPLAVIRSAADGPVLIIRIGQETPVGIVREDQPTPVSVTRVAAVSPLGVIREAR